MIRNYFIVAWRNIVTNKLFSLINIAGLSIGLSVCVLISMYIQNELSYDTHWANADRIMKINWEETTNGVTDPYGVCSLPTGPALKENFPEIENFVRVIAHSSEVVSTNNNYFNETDQFSVDSTFMDIFNYELLLGDQKSCLKRKNSVVISSDMAKKYFGNSDPIGKILTYPDGPYTVTGVLAKQRHASHIRPSALLTLDAKRFGDNNWFWINAFTYVKLKKPVAPEELDKKLKVWISNFLDPSRKQQNIGYTIALKSARITDVHFDNYHKDPFEKANKNYITIFGWAAAFILLIACFNYTNLSTARGLRRSKEIGLRKVIGASRRQLIAQFMGESLIVSLISLVFALMLLLLVIPLFNSLTGKSIEPAELMGQSGFWVSITSLTIFITITGGGYPAFFLSGFQPVNVLKNQFFKMVPFFDQIRLRQVLVVAQFVISVSIVIGTLVVYQQLKHMKNKDLGFNKDQVMVIKLPDYDSTTNNKVTVFKNRITSNSHILNFSRSYQALNTAGNILIRNKYEGRTGQFSSNIAVCDYDYVGLLEIKVIRGRNFSKEIAEDKNSFLINEAAAKLLGFKEPLSAELCVNDSSFGKIIGIVKDYNYQSPHIPINPLVIFFSDPGKLALIKLQAQDVSQTVEFISNNWKDIFPKVPISYYFLDERFERQYQGENRVLSIFICFSTLTIFISCLGLFGLASFIIGQRAKEIGIRKVVGASVLSIVFLISRNFLFLVFIAVLIASPVAYYFSSAWLQNFAYRIELSWLSFILPGALAVIIAFITVSFKSFNAANTNPVKNLRTE